MLNVLITSIMALISLAPAVLLYWLFPSNSADVTLMDQAIKLGGPIAAFIATFVILAQFYNKLAVKSAELPVLVRKKIGPLTGVWRIVSESAGPTGAVRVSSVRLNAIETGIKLDGGSFEEPGAPGSASKLVGQWKCDIAFCDGQRLLYIYDLQEMKGLHKGRHRGIVDAQLDAGTAPPCFKGTWETLGGPYHSGQITLTKQV